MGPELVRHVRQEDTASGAPRSRLALAIRRDRDEGGGEGFVTVDQVVDDPAGALAEIRRLRGESMEWRAWAGYESARTTRSATLVRDA